MGRALSLAIEYGISAYDAQYVFLATTIGARLVSQDRKLHRLLPDLVLSMTDSTPLTQSPAGIYRLTMIAATPHFQNTLDSRKWRLRRPLPAAAA